MRSPARLTQAPQGSRVMRAAVSLEKRITSPERPAAKRVLLHLPMPPSSNNVWAYRKGGGVSLSKPYARWLVQAGWRLQQQKPGRIVGGYVLTLFLPAVSRMDQDNAIAGISDLLQGHRVIADDREAEETHLHWHGTSTDVIAELVPFAGPSRYQRPAPSTDRLIADARGGRS